MMYTLKDLMNFFSIPERTIRRHLSEGVLNGTKIGGVWRFSDQDIQEYADNKSIVDYLTKTSMDKLNDYARGFVKHKDDICLTFNHKNMQDGAVKNLTSFVNHFQNPFYFNINNNYKNRTIIFIGNIDDSIDLINKFKEYTHD